MYSDELTPKSLNVMNLKSGRIYNTMNNTVNHSIKVKSHREPGIASFMYKIIPPNTAERRGIILYIHPGIHSDFSPRWDEFLFTLAHNGYTVIAPNYPMSSGFGKSFSKLEWSVAITDLARIVDVVTLENPDVPVFILTSSSGNLPTQDLLISTRGKGVKGVAVMFGTLKGEVLDTFVPTLYLAGVNDPITSLRTLKQAINNGLSSGKADVFAFKNEGHWFRRIENKRKP